VGAGRHTSAGTSGRPPGSSEDATHALRQAPTRAREHCERSLKSLCVAADHNLHAGRVGLCWTIRLNSSGPFTPVLWR